MDPVNDCVKLLHDGLTCPGGLGEYAICYGVPTAHPNYVLPVVVDSEACKDKAGKWRKKKCKKKQEKGKCQSKKVKKKCKATCASCNAPDNKELDKKSAAYPPPPPPPDRRL